MEKAIKEIVLSLIASHPEKGVDDFSASEILAASNGLEEQALQVADELTRELVLRSARFKVGDPVVFTNDYGVVFAGKTICDIQMNDFGEVSYLYTPTDSPWFYVREKNLSIDAEANPLIKTLAVSCRLSESVADPEYWQENLQGIYHIRVLAQSADQDKGQIAGAALKCFMDHVYLERPDDFGLTVTTLDGEVLLPYSAVDQQPLDAIFDRANLPLDGVQVTDLYKRTVTTPAGSRIRFSSRKDFSEPARVPEPSWHECRQATVMQTAPQSAITN